MDSKQCRELLMMIWQTRMLSSPLSTTDGRSMTIRNFGERRPGSAIFDGVEITLDNNAYFGSVQFIPYSEICAPSPDNIILCVSNSDKDFKLSIDGQRLPLVVIEPPYEVQRRFETLSARCSSYDCGYEIATLDSLKRVSLYTSLYIERLKDKSAEVMQFLEQTDKDWHRTMHIMFLKTLGGSTYKNAYTTLALRVPPEAIYRERDSLISLEALLIGASGLLEIYSDDDYTMALRKEFEHFSLKYSIRAMGSHQWKFKSSKHNQRPQDYVVLRLAQAANLFHQNGNLFQSIMDCHTVEDMHTLFCVEASEYWSTHYTPSSPSGFSVKRIGKDKAELLGINFAAVMQFAYGDYTDNVEQKEKMIEMLEKTPVENNTIIRGWRSCGVKIENAFDAQALLQLNKKYCTNGWCSICPVGKKIIKDVLVKKI